MFFSYLLSLPINLVFEIDAHRSSSFTLSVNNHSWFTIPLQKDRLPPLYHCYKQSYNAFSYTYSLDTDAGMVHGSYWHTYFLNSFRMNSKAFK